MAKLTNEEILGDIYNQNFQNFGDRIPDPTQASLQQSLDAMLSDPMVWNAFQHNLVNRIGRDLMREMVFTNPLKVFKQPAMLYGHTIQEIKSGLIKARTYSADMDAMEDELFAQERIHMETAFHHRNRQDKYKFTVNTMELRQAVLEQGGLDNLLRNMLGAAVTSDEIDEFLIMTNLFTEFTAKNATYKVQVPDMRSMDATPENARRALKIMQATAGEMQFVSSKYNSAGMQTLAKPDELVMFVTPQWDANVDVEALAGAFNVDKLALSGRKILIPQDQMPNKTTQAMITTTDFFVAADTFLETNEQANAAGLYTNYWLHHHGIYSASRMAPLVELTTETVGETITVSVPVTAVAAPVVKDGEGTTVTEVERGSVYLATAAVTPTNADTLAVKFTLTGGMDSKTRVDQNGILHVGPLEDAEEVELTATSVWVNPANPDAAKVASLPTTLTITGDKAPAWPRPPQA